MSRLIPFLLLIVTVALSASELFGADPQLEERGAIEGVTLDRNSEEPLGFVYVHLEELNKTATAHADGSFSFEEIPAGEYTIGASRVGYQSISQKVTIEEGETSEVTLSLKPSVLSSEAVEVVGMAEGSASNLADASKAISGTELRQNLAATLSETMAELPGLSSRSMGSAPSRPIIRGLGGERVLILQDGERTGDVSSQSADHAVTVDPMAAEEIELARGPEALEYGANAIGGVVNVVRNQITSDKPDHLHGTASLQGKSVNSGMAAAVNAGMPIAHNIALKFDGNMRTANNLQTPEGALDNSGLLSTNNALGLSYINPWGYAGLASSMYLNNYGIPPDPEGGHTNGVDIEMQKYQVEGKTEIDSDSDFFNSFKGELSFKSYHHKEIEQGGSIGTEYGVLTTNARITADHDEFSLFDEGRLGLWGETKNYAVSGTRTPDSDAHSIAGFLMEEKAIGALNLKAGTRFELIRSTPESQYYSNTMEGEVRQRQFSGLASSFAAVYNLGNGFSSGGTLMHSFRAPSQEELYSEGPHLASYSYEVGNPDLDPERGLGKELFIRYSSSKASAEIGIYHNSFGSYIYPRNTGNPSPQFPSLNLYQFRGVDALFQGGEASFEVALWSNWAVSGSTSYTHAQRRTADNNWTPLPMIPPLEGNFNVKYASGGFQLGAKTRVASAQSRTDDFEEPTDGYAVFDLFTQYRFESAGLLHTFSLNTENIFNATYRNHLSRIKELMPEAGRNVSLLYRIYF